MEEGRATGIQRRIRIWSDGTIFMHEGQFRDNSVCGFCRYTTIYANGEFEQYIGNWFADEYSGYGKQTQRDGKTKEGIFDENQLYTKDQNDKYVNSQGQELEAFDPEEYEEAKTIDFEKYVIRIQNES